MREACPQRTTALTARQTLTTIATQGPNTNPALLAAPRADRRSRAIRIGPRDAPVRLASEVVELNWMADDQEEGGREGEAMGTVG